MRRWLKRPEGSNWGDFGEDDQIGRMNLVTAARRLAAVRSVEEGLAFPLGLPLDHPKKQVFAGRNPPVDRGIRGLRRRCRLRSATTARGERVDGP